MPCRMSEHVSRNWLDAAQKKKKIDSEEAISPIFREQDNVKCLLKCLFYFEKKKIYTRVCGDNNFELLLLLTNTRNIWIASEH